MAPRKRISRIPTRLEVVVTDGSGRSIGTQTDREPNPRYVPQPTKSQKIREKIKQLSKKPDEPSCSSSASSSASSSSLAVRKWGNHYPKSFLPGPNEKACQVMESELAAVTRPKSEFAYKMQALKTEVDRRRVESIIGDIHRLDALDEMINRDPPPRWAVACDMWLEVDRLEARVEAFTKAAKKRKSDADKKTVPQSDSNKTVPQSDANKKTVLQSDANKKTVPQSDANKKKIPQSDANKKKIPQDEMINRDPPPRCAAASDKGLGVDRLEARVEVFTTAAKKRKSDANKKKIPQSDAKKKKISQSGKKPM